MSVIPNTTIEMPHELALMLKDYLYIRNTNGYSQAITSLYKKDEEALYLKAEQSESEIKREYSIMKWLSGRLPVPEIKYFDEYNGWSFMLTTGLESSKKPKEWYLPESYEKYEKDIGLLAEGLFMLQRVDITDCPFVISNEINFQNAIKNIEPNYVNMFIHGNKDKYDEDSGDLLGQFRFGNHLERPFDSPTEFYDWMLKNKPQPYEELCFTHGDYSNFIDDGNKIIGFIDVGGAGINTKWTDIAFGVRSIGYRSKNVELKTKYVDLLFQKLSLTPDWNKINYHIWLGRMIRRNFTNGIITQKDIDRAFGVI